MNFLAHLYLSGNDQELMVGNFIADGVKGAAYKNYSAGIAKGILLHRAIDDYTDKHPVFMQSVKRIRVEHGKFAGVIADIFYDHFLAANWENYSEIELPEYVNDVHELMLRHENIMPEKSRMFLKYMIRHNWLVSYASINGIGEVLYGMSRRTKYTNTMDKSVVTLEKHYDDFKNEFELFFEDVKKFVIKANSGI